MITIKYHDMEECDNNSREKNLCFNLSRNKNWVVLHTVIPSGFTFLLHLSATVLDLIIGCRLIYAENLVTTGIITLLLVYVPILLTLVLVPPQLPQSIILLHLLKWTISLIINTVFSPLTISISLLKHLNWTIWAIRMQKPQKELLNEYEQNLPRQIHSFLFLQGLTQCVPQAILQLYLRVLRVEINHLTGTFQEASMLVSLIKLACCVACYHRYEAQVVGGRAPILLFTSPTFVSGELIPISPCLQGRNTALNSNSPLAEVVLFISWLLLSSGRILCIVISIKVHISVTLTILCAHFLAILLYLIFSQSTTLMDIPSRVINATLSIIVLVEVSVRFYRTSLLYSLFFICLLAEDTFLMVFFFIYPSDKCFSGSLECNDLGLYAYFIINSHVLGVIIFGIYLVRLQPSHNSVSLATSAGTTVT